MDPKSVRRYVPEQVSLSDDAPGWLGNDTHCVKGPICWKCKGQKLLRSHEICTVCQGQGRVSPKRADVEGARLDGKITRGRKSSTSWEPIGPTPYALTAELQNEWTQMIRTVSREKIDVSIDMTEQAEAGENLPLWIPKPGEELCNLVGSWRILQRVGSHRWTTDDLCTAYYALQTALDSGLNRKQEALRYLDLGTGNGSVLQMTYWALCTNSIQISEAVGVEARSEAVALGRRSLSFNIDSRTQNVRIHHGDFRSVELGQLPFDLITGTPPYFRVDFEIASHDNFEEVSAIINQGGMPTSKQSAPARCEFRGGIEAYCEAASKFLTPTKGRFVVCENWLNDKRVAEGAKAASLSIIKRLDVIGRTGKDTLFSVYVMAKEDRLVTNSIEIERLEVRGYDGDWTSTYKRRILDSMNIPYL